MTWYACYKFGIDGKKWFSIPLILSLCFDLQEFSGVGGLSDDTELETDTKKMPTRTLEILASCHALVFVDNKLVCYFLLLSSSLFYRVIVSGFNEARIYLYQVFKDKAITYQPQTSCL